MPEQRMYHAPNLNLAQLSHSLAEWFRYQKFEVQLLEAPGGGAVIQARQEEAWRSVLGMSATLNVLLRHQQDGNLMVEIGAGKWIDKAAAAGVGVFILWPMLLTAGFGAWQQSQLPQKTFEYIQNFIATGGSLSADMAMAHAAQLHQARQVVGMPQAPIAPGMPGSPTPQQGYGQPYQSQYQEPPAPPAPYNPPVASMPPVTSEAPAEALAGAPSRFCMECGMKLTEGAKFCANCGTKVS